MKNYLIREIPKDEAIEFVHKYHYSKILPRLTKIYLGVFNEKGLVGVLTLGYGTQPKNTIKKILPNSQLDTKDYIADARLVEKDSTEIIAVSEDGLGARYSLSDFDVTGRATKGKQLQKGEMAGFILVSPLDKEIAVSSNQNIIKVPIESINLVNRGAIGSKIINTKEKITGVVKEL